MNKTRWIILISIVLGIAGGVIAFLKIRKQKTLDEQALLAALKAGVGKQGEDIDSLLLETTADSKYTLSAADNSTLLAAHGTFSDTPTNLNQVLSGKTKAQLKALAQQFENKNGQTLDAFVRSIFADWDGFDQDGYNGILDIVSSAK